VPLLTDGRMRTIFYMGNKETFLINGLETPLFRSHFSILPFVETFFSAVRLFFWHLVNRCGTIPYNNHKHPVHNTVPTPPVPLQDEVWDSPKWMVNQSGSAKNRVVRCLFLFGRPPSRACFSIYEMLTLGFLWGGGGGGGWELSRSPELFFRPQTCTTPTRPTTPTPPTFQPFPHRGYIGPTM